MQSMMGSRGTEVDFEVRVCWRPWVPDWSATAELEKVFSLNRSVSVVCQNGTLGL